MSDRSVRAGDPFAYAAERERVRQSRRTEAELVEAIREDGERTGRPMTPSERESFAQGFFAPEYVLEARPLSWALMMEDDEDE